MTHADALAMLVRERESSLLAQAQAARWAKQARSAAETAGLRCGVAARSVRIHAPGRGSAGTRLVRAVLAADRGAVEAELADQAAFNSPIRRYTNRADVAHLLSLLGAILPGARVERTWQGRRGTATVVSAVLDHARLDGIVEELRDRDGRVREVTLMLRPHSVMMSAIKRMAAALELDPLPATTLFSG